LKFTTFEDGRKGHLFTLLDLYKANDYYLNNSELTTTELNCYSKGKHTIKLPDLYTLQQDYLEKVYCYHDNEPTTPTTNTGANEAAAAAASAANQASEETTITVNDTITIIANASSAASAASNNGDGSGAGEDDCDSANNNSSTDGGTGAAAAAAASSSITIIINNDGSGGGGGNTPSSTPASTPASSPNNGTNACKTLTFSDNDYNTHVYIDKTKQVDNPSNIFKKIVLNEQESLISIPETEAETNEVSIVIDQLIVENGEQYVPFMESDDSSSFITIEKKNNAQTTSNEGKFTIPTIIELLLLHNEEDSDIDEADYIENEENANENIERFNSKYLNITNNSTPELQAKIGNLDEEGHYDTRWGGNGGFIPISGDLKLDNAGCLFLEFKVDELPLSNDTAITEADIMYPGVDDENNVTNTTFVDTEGEDPVDINTAHGMWIGLSSSEKVHNIFDPYTIGLHFRKYRVRTGNTEPYEYTDKTYVSILSGEQGYGDICLEDFIAGAIIQGYDDQENDDNGLSNDNISTSGITDFTLDKLYWRVGFCYNGYSKNEANFKNLVAEHEYFPIFNWGYKPSDTDEIIWREWPLFNTALDLTAPYYSSGYLGAKGVTGVRGMLYKDIGVGGAKLLSYPQKKDTYNEALSNQYYVDLNLDNNDIQYEHPKTFDSNNRHMLIVGSIVKSGKFCNVCLKINQPFDMNDGKNQIFSMFENSNDLSDIVVYNKLLLRSQQFTLPCLHDIVITNKQIQKKDKHVIILTNSPPLSQHTIGKSVFYQLFSKLYNPSNHAEINHILFTLLFKESPISNINDFLISIHVKLINRLICQLIKKSTIYTNNKVYVKQHINLYEDIQTILSTLPNDTTIFDKYFNQYDIYKEYRELDNKTDFIKQINEYVIYETQHTRLLKRIFIEYNNHEILHSKKHKTYTPVYTPLLTSMDFKISNAYYNQDN